MWPKFVSPFNTSIFFTFLYFVIPNDLKGNVFFSILSSGKDDFQPNKFTPCFKISNGSQKYQKMHYLAHLRI